MATPVAPKLFQALIDIKKNHDELDGDHIQYDHIPQSAAVVDSQITHLKSTGWNPTKDAEKKERKAIHDKSLSIAIPKWLHLNGETFGSKLSVESTASLPQLLLRDVSSEWNAWINPGKHTQNKADLQIQDLEALGAYRYLAKRFTKVYSLHQTPFQPWEPTLTEIDQFFTNVLKKLSQA